MKDRNATLVAAGSNELLPLADGERKLLSELLKPGVSIQAVIPEDATAEQLWETLRICVTGLNMLEARAQRLKPIIGKILLIFRDKPSLYKQLGYRTFEEFRLEGVGKRLGLGRTALWEAQLIARDWPQLVRDPELYVKLGRSKLMILHRFTRGREASAAKWIDLALGMSSTELLRYATSRGLIEAGETIPCTIVIRCDKRLADRWKEFISDGRIRQVAGGGEDRILEAMMDECYQHWIALYEHEQLNSNLEEVTE